MKKYQSLVFYIKNRNRRITFDSLVSNYVTPICGIFNQPVDKIEYYTNISGKDVNKKCKFNKKQIFQNYYIDINDKCVQIFTFSSKELINVDEEWPTLKIRLSSKLDELELEINFNDKIINMNAQIYNDIIDIINNNNMEIFFSFLYDYSDLWNHLLLIGCSVGLMTYKKRKLVRRIMNLAYNSYDSKYAIVGIFKFNYINKKLLTKARERKIIEIVGDNNYISKKNGIIFECNNSLMEYRIEKLLELSNKKNAYSNDYK